MKKGDVLMFEVQPIEFFLRGIPEGFLITLAICVFTKTNIDKKNYIITSMINSFIIFGVRTLPVTQGVHTIIGIGLTMLLVVIRVKIDTIQVIKATLIYVICQLISEAINIFIVENIFKEDVTLIFSNPVSKSIYGIPSLLIIFILIMISHIFIKRKKVL